jgi:hypothetical protein
MSLQELYEEHWLLAYEASVQGWLPSADPANHVSADPNFQYLSASGVTFYSHAPMVSAPGTAMSLRRAALPFLRLPRR